MVSIALKAADRLSEDGIESYVVNARFIKPIDKNMIEELSEKVRNIVVIEEGVSEGGFGSAVLEVIERENITGVKVKRIGLPSAFLEHGKREELFIKYHLTPEAVYNTIKTELVKI